MIGTFRSALALSAALCIMPIGSALPQSTPYPVQHVLNESALAGYYPGPGPSDHFVWRDGYAASGDSAPVYYKWTASCSLGVGGDNGAQVQITATGGGCWTTAVTPVMDVAIWGALGTAADDSLALRNAAYFSSQFQVAIQLHGGATYKCNSPDLNNGSLGCIVGGTRPKYMTAQPQSYTDGSFVVTVGGADFIPPPPIPPSTTSPPVYIGIQLSDGSVQPALVGTVSGTGPWTITLANGSTFNTNISSGAKVWLYSSSVGNSYNNKSIVFVSDRSNVNELSGGISSPEIILGSNLNVPLYYQHPCDLSLVSRGISWNGNGANQSGWTSGGPHTSYSMGVGTGGKLYTMQFADGVGSCLEGSMTSEHSIFKFGYNGNVYEGTYRGSYWSVNDAYYAGGQTPGDVNLDFGGLDTTVFNAQVGGGKGIGVQYEGGGVHQWHAGGIFGQGGIAMDIGGTNVAALDVEGLEFDSNGGVSADGVSGHGGCLVDENNPTSGTSATHTFRGVIFNSCNQGQAADSNPDVNQRGGATNSILHLVQPTFAGHESSQPGSVLPSYNIQSSGGIVWLTDPGWGTLGWGNTFYQPPLPAPQTGAAFNDCAKIRGEGNWSCPWTPTLQGSMVAGTQSYTTQSGSYHIHGQWVEAQAFLTTSASSGATGNLVMGGFPVAAANTPALSSDVGGCTFLRIQGYTAPTNYSILEGAFAQGNSMLSFWRSSQSGNNPALSAVTEWNMNAAGVIANCHYRING